MNEFEIGLYHFKKHYKIFRDNRMENPDFL